MLEVQRIGLVANERNGWPAADEVTALGASWLRTIVFDVENFQARINALPANVGVIALLNSEAQMPADPDQTVGPETEADWEARWTELITAFADRFGNGKAGRPIAVECLNEWDRLDIPLDRVIKSVQIAAPLLRPAGLKVLFGSVAGGTWPASLQDAMDALTDDDRRQLDGVCFHPYVKTVGGTNGSPVVPSGWDGTRQSMIDAVEQAHSIINPEGVEPRLSLWLTEFGLNRTDVGGDDTVQASYIRQAFEDLGSLSNGTVEVACLFCWNDSVGAPGEQFGLRPIGGEPAYAGWRAFQDCTSPREGVLAG